MTLSTEPSGPTEPLGATPQDATSGTHESALKGSLGTALTIAAAVVVPVLYLLYIAHYVAVVPVGDDWTLVPLVNASLHGHLSFDQLWRQHTEARMLFPNLVFLVSGRIDHLNETHLALLSGVIFIAGFALMLRVLRGYLGRRLTALPVLSIAVVWFSLADYGNAVWDFQLAWFMVVFCLMAMIYLLLFHPGSRRIAFVLALVAGVVASYSFTQGLLLWPVGLICLLWKSPRERQARTESAVWVGVAVVTTAVYFIGFNPHNNGCFSTARGCSPAFALEHPVISAKFFTALVGNVIPTAGLNFYFNSNIVHSGAHEILGLVITAVAVFVVVQSIRERRHRLDLPVPLALVAYALLADLLITIGRAGTGAVGAIVQTRYSMGNILLLVGIVAYAWNHLPVRTQAADTRLSFRIRVVGLALLAVFVVVQCVESTDFGMSNGSAQKGTTQSEGQFLANFDRIPVADQQCEVDHVIFFGLGGSSAAAVLRPELAAAEKDHLSLFSSNAAIETYRSEGALPVAGCTTG